MANIYKQGCGPVQLSFNLHHPSRVQEGKTPVIFLHGMTCCKKFWLDIPEIVANETGRKVYVPDLRNHGDSERGVFNLNLTADDVLHFMDTHDIPRAVLVGHSMGAYCAFRTALKWPGRVEKLLIEDSHTSWMPETVSMLLLQRLRNERAALRLATQDMDEAQAKDSVVQHLYNSAPDYMKRLYYPPHSIGQLELRRGSSGQWEFKTNYDALIAGFEDLKNIQSEQTGLFSGPVLLLYGTLSPCNANKEEAHIRNLCPNFSMVAIKDAYHRIHTEFPKEFTEWAIKFLKE